MIWTTPNILTVARILAAPCVALVFVVFDRPVADWLAFGLFAGAAVTDYLDGWLARRLGETSEIGKMLDPIADKAMVIIALAVLMAHGPRPPIMLQFREYEANAAFVVIPATVIILREVLVSGLREYLGDVKLDVTKLAKWKTTIQMLGVGGLLLVAASRSHFDEAYFAATGGDPSTNISFDDRFALLALAFSEYIRPFALAILSLAAILTVVTGWDYFRKGLAYIREREAK